MFNIEPHNVTECLVLGYEGFIQRLWMYYKVRPFIFLGFGVKWKASVGLLQLKLFTSVPLSQIPLNVMQIKLLKMMSRKYFITALLALGVLHTGSFSPSPSSSSSAVAAAVAAATPLSPRPDEHLLCGCKFIYAGVGSSYGVPQMPDITQMSQCCSKTTIAKHMLLAAGWIRAGVWDTRSELLIK